MNGYYVEKEGAKTMLNVFVSACLLGEAVRYDGKAAECDEGILREWTREGRIVPFCPEVAAGCSVPRPPAEIDRGAEGADVLDDNARVMQVDGIDATDLFRKGAELALREAVEHGVAIAVLKERSPSCGSSRIYDGSFGGVTKPGRGVTAELLARNGIVVFSENEFEKAAERLRDMERTGVPPAAVPRG